MSKGRPWKSLMCEGLEVRIGRSAAGNDEVTNSLLAADLWLHVASGYAGAHVGILNEAGVIPQKVIDQAARWAAWHSEARNHGPVRVYLVSGDEVTSSGGTANVDWKSEHRTLDDVQPEQPPVPAQPAAGGLHVDHLWSVVVGALRKAIDDHGPIEKANLSSATKRILAAIRGAEKEAKAWSIAEDALDALEGMVEQYFDDHGHSPDGLLVHGHAFLSAGEAACDVLAKYRPGRWYLVGGGITRISPR